MINKIVNKISSLEDLHVTSGSELSAIRVSQENNALKKINKTKKQVTEQIYTIQNFRRIILLVAIYLFSFSFTFLVLISYKFASYSSSDAQVLLRLVGVLLTFTSTIVLVATILFQQEQSARSQIIQDQQFVDFSLQQKRLYEIDNRDYIELLFNRRMDLLQAVWRDMSPDLQSETFNQEIVMEKIVDVFTPHISKETQKLNSFKRVRAGLSPKLRKAVDYLVNTVIYAAQSETNFPGTRLLGSALASMNSDEKVLTLLGIAEKDSKLFTDLIDKEIVFLNDVKDHRIWGTALNDLHEILNNSND